MHLHGAYVRRARRKRIDRHGAYVRRARRERIDRHWGGIERFRYGQTGSGKTWTMMGPVDNPGVNRRAIKELLTNLDAAKDTISYKLHAAQVKP